MASLSLMTGIFFGQILFGTLGDFIGRKSSFLGSTLTMAIGSALNIFTGSLPLVSSYLSPLVEFVIFRFVVGLGAGGLYPIVATVTRESSQEELANSVIALVFGPIGSVGLILAPLVVLFLSLTELSNTNQWRILLLIGAIPAFLLLLLTIQETDELRSIAHSRTGYRSKGFSSSQFSAMESSTISMSSRLERFSVQFRSSAFRSYLCGVSLSWFFSDLLHYGNMLYQVLFLDSLLSDKNTFDDDNYHFSIGILAAIGLGSAIFFWLGGLLSILALRKVSALSLQLHGFTLASVAFFLVSICKTTLPKICWPVTIAFYMSTYLIVGLGPAPTTFLVPSLLFSSSFSGIRSTVNGLASACGKLGAVVAVLTVGYAGFDISTLMAFFGAVGLLGMASTLFTIRAHIRSDTSHYSINSGNNNRSAGGVHRSEYMQIPYTNDEDMFIANDEDDIIPGKDDEGGNSNNITHKIDQQEILSRNGLIFENNASIQPKLSPESKEETNFSLPVLPFNNRFDGNHYGGKHASESEFPVKKSFIDESLITRARF